MDSREARRNSHRTFRDTNMTTPQVVFNVGMKGFFKIEAIRPDGTRRLLADWFPNIITNNGLNLWTTTTQYINFCQVGAGNSTPLVTDTALASFIAGTVNPTIDRNINGLAPPYYSYLRNVYRFTAGVAAGNLSEVGVGAQNNGNLFSRALIVDGGGNPTTITVLGDEVLDVTYELRMYPKVTDTVSVIVLDGVNYTATIRPASILTESSWRMAVPGNNPNFFTGGGGTVAYPAASVLGPITGIPTGSTSADQATVSSAAYITNSYYRDVTLSFNLNDGNRAGGTGAMLFYSSPGQYQIGYSPAIPKDNTKILSIVVRFAWARQP